MVNLHNHMARSQGHEGKIKQIFHDNTEFKENIRAMGGRMEAIGKEDEAN